MGPLHVISNPLLKLFQILEAFPIHCSDGFLQDDSEIQTTSFTLKLLKLFHVPTIINSGI